MDRYRGGMIGSDWMGWVMGVGGRADFLARDGSGMGVGDIDRSIDGEDFRFFIFFFST